MFLKWKKKWLKLNSGLLSFVMLFTTIGPVISPSTAQATVAASGPTVSQPKTVELPWYRNETTKVFGNPDGTLTAEVYSEPIHYLEGNHWLDIDNTLDLTADGKSETNRANHFNVKFPKKPKEKDLTRLFDYSIAGKNITFGLSNTLSKNQNSHVNPQDIVGEFQGNNAKFSNLYPGVTFDYSVEGSKVKENIVLESYQGKNTFEFLIKGSGLTASKKSDGSIEFKDKASGKFLFNIPRPYMFDSNKQAGPEGVTSQAVNQDITPTKDGFILTITADEAFLKDPATIYPLTIDPWIDYFNAQDTYIASSYLSTNYYSQDRLYVGHDATIGATRSLVKWPSLPDIPDAEVLGGQIGFYQYDAYTQVAPVEMHRITSGWSHNSVTWGTALSYNLVPESTIDNASFQNNWYNYFDATNLIKDWYANPQSNNGVIFKYADSQEYSNTRRSFHSSEWVNPDGTPVGKPKLVITFRSKEFLGLSDYWKFTPDIFQGEGTGVVNVINGNFVYNIPVLDLNSRLNAFNLQMVYNSRSPYQDAWGYGWTFSAQRRLIFNSDKTIIEYLDEDGTRSHFTKLQTNTATTYTAPEGTYLELTPVGSEYTLKQPDETVLYFDQYGRNYKIVDEKGNTVKYVFDTSAPDSRKIVQIQERYGSETTGRDINLAYRADGLLDTITDLKGTQTKFNYDINGIVSRLSSITYAYGTADAKPITFGYDSNNRLITVADAKGNVGKVEYDASNKVSKVTDPRSTTEIPLFATLDYNPTGTQTIFTDAKGYKTYYKNNSDQNKPTVNVIEMTEDYQGIQPATTTYDWDKNTLKTVIEPNKDTGAASGSTHTGTYDTKANLTQATSPNNLALTNTYDAKSNPTRVDTNGTAYDNLYDAKSNLISSTNNTGLTDYNTYDQFGNALTGTTPTRVTHNRLQNSSFELAQSGQPTLWTNRGIGQYSAATDAKVFGNNSGKIYLSPTDGAGYFSQLVPVTADEADKDYTLSVYVKASGVTGTGANLRVYFKDANGNFIYSGGNIVKYESKAISGTTDWTRLSNYFTTPAGTATIQVDLLFTGAGTVYFDGAELVYGKVLDNYYSTENASFEWGNLDNWTMSSLGTGDGKSSEQAIRGSYSLKINGTTANKYVGQYAEVQGNVNDPLTLSGWAYSTGSNPSGGYFALDVVVMYTDGTDEVFIREFDKTRANQWQMVKSTIRASKPFNQAKVYLLYYNQTGAAYFDNIKLEQRSSLSQQTYDSSGNFVKTQTDALNNTSSFNYDANGNLQDSTDASGKKVSFVYTLLNKLKSVTLKGATTAEDIQVSYGYDAQGNLTSRTDPNGRVTTFDYNAINKAVTETDPIGKYITSDYDENGNLKSTTRGKGTNIVQSESYTYDRKNRLFEMFVSGAKQFTNTYNFADDKSEVTLADGVTKYTYSYDADHRLLTAAEPGNAFTLTNEYGTTAGNTNGMRTKYTESFSGLNKSTTFNYDGLRRMISTTGPEGGLIEFYYNEQGNQSRIKSASTEIFQDFDNAGRLTSQAVIGSSKLDLKNSYFANGQVQTYTEGSTTHTFAYDFAKRLYSWNNGSNTVTYSYDKAGNLSNPHGLNLTFNEANEIIGFLYDDAGNLTQDNKYIYTWNQQGQLTSVKDLSNNVIASYTYNPDGLRKSKMVGSTSYYYHYDGTNLIRITNNSGATVWSFTWAGGKLVSMTNASGTTYYYVTNFRGDVIRIMDGNGNSVASYSYDPWGKVLSATEDPAVSGQPLRYASYIYDTESQLYYLQARYYDPETARFISRDPDGGDLNNPFSQNLYAYANDDPVNNVDPDGKWAWAASLFFVPGAGQILAGAVLVTAAIVATVYLGHLVYTSYITPRGPDSWPERLTEKHLPDSYVPPTGGIRTGTLNGRTGYLDKKGNVWAQPKGKGRHGKPHWDVQLKKPNKGKKHNNVPAKL